MNPKRLIYQTAKRAGLFSLGRAVTRRGLRILCYHGLSIGDEHLFRPRLFMPAELFRERMRELHQFGYPVLSLEDAVNHLEQDTLPDFATVITFDDGFYSQYLHAAKILKEFSFPATFYVTTYYVSHPHPIFRLAVQYLFWKTKKTSLDSTGLPGMSVATVDILQEKKSPLFQWELIRFAETQLTEPARQDLCRELARRLGLEFAEIEKSRGLSLMDTSELESMVKDGFDLQLHTHRHSCPTDKAAVQKELVENRAVLEPIAGIKLTHLCYPSGEWSNEHLEWLPSLDIRSATTCDPGLNLAGTNPLSLRRYLDATCLSTIEFDAELSGFSEVLRRARNRVLFRS